MSKSADSGDDLVCGLPDNGHVLMWQFGEGISAVAEWWEEVMSVWRDRGWELVLLSYVIAWVAVLYMEYILTE